ncbi:hypothetical protein [Halobellus rufus]|uniref:hypothetical protein n=1 Tax=Halobellus rufus TaxID=1448860 RepID=UPI000ABE8713|nr:hypothetical protein [Halobellus rufus]
MWTNNFRLPRREYDPAIVDWAFALLKAGEQPEGRNISVRTFDPTSDGTDEGFFERFFGTEEEDTLFEEWLVEFETDVHERTEYLREQE